VVLQTPVKRGHLVGHISDHNPWTKDVGGEDDRAIFEANLGVLELVAVGLLLRILAAAGEMGRY
jgi:hypothetical protein